MMANRPNILYFVCHDLGKHLGCYGNPVSSPNLDRFAREGVRFNRAYCNAAACSPSRACAMTGRYANQTGGLGLSHMGWSLDPSVRTIVEDLREGGYQTAHAGLAHEWHPHSERYEVEMARHWDDWHAANAVDDAITFLRTRDRSRPFYLNIGTQETHVSRFSRDEVVADEYGGRTAAEDSYLPGYIEDTADHRRFMGGFQSAIRYLDRQFQRLLDALETSGYAANTFVIFTTDHGIVAPGVGRAKATAYERGMEISLLIRPPEGYARGYEVDHLVPNIDFRATLNAVADCPIPTESAGRSFLSLLRGEAYEPHERIFTERNFHGEKPNGATGYVDFCDPLRSIHTKDYHYMRCFDPALKDAPDPWLLAGVTGGKRESEYLFNIREDSMELVNLVHRPEHRRVLEAMRTHLHAWMESTGDWLLTGTAPPRPEAPGWGDWPRQPARTPWRAEDDEGW